MQRFNHWVSSFNLLILAASGGILFGTESTLIGQSPSTLPLQLAIDKTQKATDSIEDFVDGGTLSDIKSRLFQRQTEKLAIDRQISSYESMQSKLEDLKSRADSFKRDWESAMRKFKQQQQNNKRELEIASDKIKSHRTKVKLLDNKWDAYLIESKKYAVDANSYETARIRFEARNGTVNDPEYKRLSKWYRDGNAWLLRLNVKEGSLRAEYTKLNADGSILNARWREILNDANLLKARLAMEKKERTYRDAERKHADEMRKQSVLKTAIANRIESEIELVNGMLSGIQRAQKVVKEAPQTQRSYYPTKQPVDNVQAVQLAPGRAVNESPASIQGRVFLIQNRTPDNKDGLIDRIRAGAAVKELDSFRKIEMAKPDPANTQNSTSTDSTKLAWSRFPISARNDDSDSIPSISGLVKDVIVDPRMYFSRKDVENAKREKARLKKLITLLDGKILELRSWRTDLKKYREEVAELHRKTVENDLGNVLNIAQIGKVAEKLSEMREYKDAVNPRLVDAIKEVDRQLLQSVKDTESLLKTYDSQTKANRAKDQKKQIINSLEGVCSLLDVSIQRLPNGDGTRDYFEAAMKIYQSGLKVIAHEENLANESEIRAERIYTLLEIMAIIYPPASVGLGIGNEINDERLRKYHIEPAAESLRYGLSKNWDAERFLIRKIKRTEEFIEQQERIISSQNRRFP